MRKLKNIGSIVLLKDATKRLMITGRFIRNNSDNKDYDYLGCLYPEGHIGGSFYIMFNDEDIETVCFAGLQDDPEDIAFLKGLDNE